MRGVVAIDGVVGSTEEATVSVFDRGFLYGDSVYEVIRTYDGRPFALREHLERLLRSAELIELELPLGVEELILETDQVLAEAGPGEWYLRLIFTRGGGPIGLDPNLAERPRRVLIVLPIPSLAESLWTEGASVVLVETGKGSCDGMPAGAKTGNYLTNIMALRKARARGGFEAIMIDGRGRIAEGTTSNVFVVNAGTLSTPPLAVGILDGITRRKVIGLCEEEGIPVVQEHLAPLDLLSAEEVFITGTLKEVMPVTSVDGNPVGDGRPGPLTRRLQALYRGLTSSRAS